MSHWSVWNYPIKRKLNILIIVLLLSVVSSNGSEISSGSSIIIIGQGSSQKETFNIAPTFSYRDSHAIKDIRDPSKYSTPTVSSPDKDKNEETDNNMAPFIIPFGKTNPITFSMSSEVYGSGSLNEWSSMQSSNDMKATQKSSATYGDFFNKRNFTLISSSSSSQTEIDINILSLENELIFIGNHYNELNTLVNSGDLIQDYFRSGAINKDSTYTGLSTYIEDDNTSIYRKITKQNINTRLLGQANLNLRISDQNCSEISEMYLGQIELNRNVSSRFESMDFKANENLFAD